jgi:hypothetical protein
LLRRTGDDGSPRPLCRFRRGLSFYLFSCVEFGEKGDDVVTNSETARHRAEASFKKKELQVRQGAEAVADYEAAGHAVEKKTARLKALRLANEAGGRQAAAAKKSRRPADSDKNAARRANRRVAPIMLP